jgi:predicted nuclease of predicted toxin-antitoxin system
LSSFLLDENVPHILVGALTLAGHEVLTAQEVGLSATPDDSVFAYAQTIGATVISLDLDFSDLRNFPLGNHFGIVMLRLKNLPPRQMADRTVIALADEVKGELYGSLVVIDAHGTREARL